MDLRSSEALKSFSSSNGAPSASRSLKKFYRGEPMALGITQLFIGILEIAFGLVISLVSSQNFIYILLQTPHWTGILYIISGSLSVAAARKPRMPLVKGSLAMNIVSAVAAGIGMVISSISMTFQRPPGRYYSSCDYYHNDTKIIQACHEYRTVPYHTLYNIVALLLTLTVLEFVIAIVSAAFGCASVCRNTYSETTIVIFQNTAEASPPPLPAS
uniref:membrane-spanning 4-domains subfamily A member 4A-like n=1 Tax=Euleptes europaea TaxID=460621 RepID=UPI0025424996|nr:membrane-spanning 4-domains subfamily A member 4A-like [Euleptes europaea]